MSPKVQNISSLPDAIIWRRRPWLQKGIIVRWPAAARAESSVLRGKAHILRERGCCPSRSSDAPDQDR
jgi:hypothetical protein